VAVVTRFLVQFGCCCKAPSLTEGLDGPIQPTTTTEQQRTQNQDDASETMFGPNDVTQHGVLLSLGMVQINVTI